MKTHLKAFVSNPWRKVLLALLLGKLFLLASCGPPPDLQPGGIALVYGVSWYIHDFSQDWDYPITNSPNLPGTGKDAIAMAGLLRDQGYEVHLRLDNGGVEANYLQILIDELLDLNTTTVNWQPPSNWESFNANLESATLAQFEADMAWVESNLQPGENLVIYWAGHGGRVTEDESGRLTGSGFSSLLPIGWDDPNPGTEPLLGDPQDEWFFFWDSIALGPPEGQSSPGIHIQLGPAPEGSVHGTMDTYSLRDDRLASLLAGLPAHIPKVLIMDNCNAGGFIGGGREVSDIPPQYFNPPENFPSIDSFGLYELGTAAIQGDVTHDLAWILAASGEREESYESSSVNGHGVFTHYLLQGVGYQSSNKPADSNNDSYVTLDELYRYTSDRILEFWNRGSSTDYHPHVSGGPVDIILF